MIYERDKAWTPFHEVLFGYKGLVGRMVKLLMIPCLHTIEWWE